MEDLELILTMLSEATTTKLKLQFADGKFYKTDVADVETI